MLKIKFTKDYHLGGHKEGDIVKFKKLEAIPHHLKEYAEETDEEPKEKKTKGKDKGGAAAVLVALLFAFLSFGFTKDAVAQVDMTSIYSLTSDTVTNTATIYLTSPKVSNSGVVTVQVNVTKISGTVAGTISLLGSLDGTTFKALNTAETQTALATVTATDATNSYHWRLSNNPFAYYRVSWVGTGTMSASFTSKIMARQLK